MRTITHKGYTIEAFSSMYMDWGLCISVGDHQLMYNPSCLSNESWGATYEDDDGNEFDEGIPWTDEQWCECLRDEADDFIEAYVQEHKANPDWGALTAHDMAHLVNEYHSYKSGFGNDWSSGYYDVMTSKGYVSLYADGTVYAHGRELVDLGVR
jgi:hypothetical protein